MEKPDLNLCFNTYEDDDDADVNGDGGGSSDGATEASSSDDGDGTETSGPSSPHHRANDRSAEHAQAVLEIVDTEISYGKDLAVIKQVHKLNEFLSSLVCW